MGPLGLSAGARRARRLLLLTACMTVGVAAVPAVAAAAPPATLTGEQFTTNTPAVFINCDHYGSFSYTASGTATGPYPGTFTETGNGTVTGASATTVGTVTALTASFTVRSPSGAVLVTGSKTLSAPSGVACQDASGITDTADVNTTYQATIDTPTGNYADHGGSLIKYLATGPSTPTFLVEDFTSALTQPVLISPTSKDQCKDGGWMNFPQFKNQGDCVRFAATGGKNPPSG